LSRAWLT